jgi:hypothetical protein
LKEGRATLAPALPCDHVGRTYSGEQRARQLFDGKCIGTGRDHQLAKLLELGLLELPRLAVERLQLRVKVTWLAHRTLRS